ncbi:hypothetical protein KC330_g9008 [Hortaea werneckii]|nr:hypothetical protein KC330_g9008 [Hortaea werneckii]
MKTVVYQRNNKAPGYFAMKGMLNVDRRFILTLKNADGDLVVPGNRAVTALDHPKTNHKDLLFGKTDKIPSSLRTLRRAELVAEQLAMGSYNALKKHLQRMNLKRVDYDRGREETAKMRLTSPSRISAQDWG